MTIIIINDASIQCISSDTKSPFSFVNILSLRLQETPNSAADEPRVICIIRDTTNAQDIQPKSITLPASYTVQQLANAVAKEYGYERQSFGLQYEQNPGHLVSTDSFVVCWFNAFAVWVMLIV